MNLLRDFERVIDEKLRSFFRTETSGEQRRELIEIQRAILEDVADHAHLLPRAKRALAANHVTIRIPAPDEDRRAALQLVFIESDALEEEIKRYLQQEQIAFSKTLKVTVELLDQDVPEISSGKGFVSSYAKRDRVTAPAGTPSVRLTPMSGIGAPLEFTKSRLQIGRVSAVLDNKRRLVRRNDLAFDEQTVSRAHAHIEFDSSLSAFRLFDDGSSYGTSVLHDGKLVDIPKAGTRGQRLASGDEIYIGQVQIKFEVL